MIGASDLRIMRSHLLPHLVGPIIVFSTLIVAASCWPRPASRSSVSGSSCRPRAGATCSPTRRTLHVAAWLMLWPGLALLLTTLAFNLLGDGLRDAFDPRSQR